jgi:hypothetical protein
MGVGARGFGRGGLRALQLPDVLVAFDCDHAAAAGGYFLDVAEGLFVLEDRAGVLDNTSLGRVGTLGFLSLRCAFAGGPVSGDLGTQVRPSRFAKG